jgi:hypothetical protein
MDKKMDNPLTKNDFCYSDQEKINKKCFSNEFTAPTTEMVDCEGSPLHRLKARIWDRYLIPFARSELPDTMEKSAMMDFFRADSLRILLKRMNEELLLNDFFLPWFLFNWISDIHFGVAHFNPALSLAENYVNRHEETLSSEERRFIDIMQQTFCSFYCILRVNRNGSFLVKDILLGTTHTIQERQWIDQTNQFNRGDILLARLLAIDQSSIFVGMAPVILPTPVYFGLLDFKEELIAENEALPLTPELLRHEFDGEVLNYFFDLMETLSHPPAFTQGKLLPFSTELQEGRQAVAKVYWENWFDQPIPALGNQTPRQAATTEKGYERLDALLIHYERGDRDRDDPHSFKADIEYIKSVLVVN